MWRVRYLQTAVQEGVRNRVHLVQKSRGARSNPSVICVPAAAFRSCIFCEVPALNFSAECSCRSSCRVDGGSMQEQQRLPSRLQLPCAVTAAPSSCNPSSHLALRGATCPRPLTVPPPPSVPATHLFPNHLLTALTLSQLSNLPAFYIIF